MSILHKPLSAVASADDPSITAANYPALAMCLRPEYVSGTSLIDPISGITFTATGTGVVNNGDGTFKKTAVAITTGTGAIPSPGTKATAIFAVGTIADSESIAIGAPSTGPGIGLSTSGLAVANGFITLSGGTNYHEITNMTKAGVTAGCLAAWIDWLNDDSYQFAIDSTSAEVAQKASTNGVGGIAAGIGSISDIFEMPQNKNFYGIYVFYFDVTPPRHFVQAAAAWMAANPTRLYPGLVGLE